jgi:hypothetical protein
LRLKICWRKTTKAKQDLKRSLRYEGRDVAIFLYNCTVLRLILQCKLMFSTVLYSVWTQSHHSWWKINVKLHFWMKTERKTDSLRFIQVCKKWVSKFRI